MNTIRLSLTAALVALPSSALAQPFAITWSTIDAGGASFIAAGPYTLGGAIGQHDAGTLTAGSLECIGGFWAGADAATAACFPNCDGSTSTPVLTANDFQCFLNSFAASLPYANCDGSTFAPVLTANDFQCFLNNYAAGCS